MDFHFANLYEGIADLMGDRIALSQSGTTTSWTDYEHRAARIAAALVSAGLKPDSKVALYTRNCPEFLEATFGTLKMRGVPIGVNFRYVEDELKYLLEDCDAEAIFYGAEFADRVAMVKDSLPKLRLLVQIGEGPAAPFAETYGDLLSTHEPMQRISRPGTDLMIIYTGGTTGYPKGVMRQQETMCKDMAQGYASIGWPIPETPEELLATLARGLEAGHQPHRSLILSPLIHGSGLLLGALTPMLLTGSAAFTLPGDHFDPALAWRTVEREEITLMAIIGDVFAKPLLDELVRMREAGTPYNITSLKRIHSSGMIWSREVKEGLLEFGDLVLLDGAGATEGSMGVSITTRETRSDTAQFTPMANTTVLGEDGKPVQPGSGEIGRVAITGNVPVGYYKDKQKSLETFPVIDGVRYAIPGDYAQIEADGSLKLLGRGSNCITTGGEKVYAEEVDDVLKRHPLIRDCLTVGIPDERFGQRVAALIELEPGKTATDEEVTEHVRSLLAGYKVPRSLTFVDLIQRGPNGKADYKWARSVATESNEREEQDA